MQNKKKICFVIPSLKAGGMERVMVELAYYFSNKTEVEVHFILLGENTNFFKMPSHIFLYEPNFKIRRSKFLYTIKVLFFLRNKLKKIRPYSLMSFGETYNNFVLLASFGLPVKKYVSDRSKPDKDWGFVQNNLRKILYRFSSGIISQTSYSKNFLKQETGHKNIFVIPNPVCMNNAEWKIEKRERIILNVGRLIKTKRIDLLLNYFYEMKLENWKLWIVGDGPIKTNLQSFAAELQLSDKVVFWGNQKDVSLFYKKASIFAFTSESEGFPNALLEAMSFGLPVISFDCIAGPADLIKDGSNGYLVEMYDEENYVKKLSNLVADPQLRLNFGLKAREKSKEFDINIIGEKYLKVLLK